jgi:predicted peroxiredoxin
MTKAAISLTTGLEDPEKVTVALLMAVGAAEGGRTTLMFLTKEAVRLATNGIAVGVACEGCPPIEELMKRYEAAGGELLACPLCFNARQLCRLHHAELLAAAHIVAGTQPLGWPVVSNGLSLCKIHHAAYDLNFIGVRPDLVIEVQTDLLHVTLIARRTRFERDYRRPP